MIRLVILSVLVSSALATPTGCKSYIDLAFAFDTSESVKVYTAGETTAYMWQQVLDLARGIVINLPIGLSVNQTQVAAVRFANTTSVMFYLDRYQTSLEAEFGINTIAVDMGNTNVNTMLKSLSGDILTVSRGMRPGSRKVAVLFTDGFSTYDAGQVNASVQALKNEGTEVFVVTVGSDYVIGNIAMLASPPLSKYFINVPTYGQLHAALPLLLAGVCNSTLNETEIVPVKPPIKCMPNCAACQTTTTCDVCEVGWYWDQATNSCHVCSIIMDLCFVVDDSGSIEDQGKGNYALLKGFVKSVVTRLDVGLNKTRMALVRFSTNSYIDFYLDTYDTATDVLMAIQDMGYEGGRTRTDLALEDMRTKVFESVTGNRPDVRDVAIIITDGNSDQPNNTLANATAAKADNITMFVVGITNTMRVDELMAIASTPTTERYFNSVDEAHLNLLLTDLTMYVCNPANQNSPSAAAAAASARKKREAEDELSAGLGSQQESGP